jgi:hypothetical protein
MAKPICDSFSGINSTVECDQVLDSGENYLGNCHSSDLMTAQQRCNNISNCKGVQQDNIGFIPIAAAYGSDPIPPKYLTGRAHTWVDKNRPWSG